MKRALITLRLLCDRCGCITNVDPLPDADAVPLDCWQAAIAATKSRAKYCTQPTPRCTPALSGSSRAALI